MSAKRPLSLYIVTFNCGRTLLDIDAFASSLFVPSKSSASRPDVIFLALQEVAPIAYSFLGGPLLAPYFSRFLHAVQRAAGSGTEYHHVITHNVGMTAIMLLLKPELSPHVQWLQTGEVGVGWSEMGNKGAAAVRIGYQAEGVSDVLPLTLVAAHLAPMEDAWQRRNEDWESIVRRLALNTAAKHTASLSSGTSPKGDAEEEPLLGVSPARLSSLNSVRGIFIPGSPVFFAGDLNYRTSDKPPQLDDHKRFPQPVMVEDDPLHWSHSLPQDQLTREREAFHTLHNLSEEPVSFPPTYKFSEKQRQLSASEAESKWLWSSHRFPSWCDRILFSTPLRTEDVLKVQHYAALPLQPTSDHRPVVLSCQLDLATAAEALSSQTPPFPLLTSWHERRVAARRKEIAIGLASYLSLTHEGNGLLLASLFGVVGGWWIMSSLLTA